LCPHKSLANLKPFAKGHSFYGIGVTFNRPSYATKD